MGAGLRNLFCSLSFTICFILQSIAAAQQQQQHPTFAMVVGTVYCDTCFQQEFTKFSHFIPGALVAVKCDGIGKNKLSFQKEEKTNQHGVFKIRLPEEVSRNVEVIKSCSVNLIRSGQHFCSMVSSATSAGLRLKSRRKDIHEFSAGFFSFKPLKQPEVCSHKPRPSASAKYSLAGQKRVQPAFFFPPPIPFLPSPPNLGGIPLPPNPFQPPPSILPPLPFQPSPPPFINVPPLPNIPQLPNIPLLPSLAPPPPPPPSIFPPLPFPPLFPGNPPAAPEQRNTP